jgi:hypothetical protein
MVSSLKLLRFVWEQGAQGYPLFADDSYECPSEGWVAETFARDFARFKQSVAGNIAGLAYNPEAFDCDDFARLAASYAGLLHRASRGIQDKTALAFGEFWFDSNTTKGGHAINIAVVAGPDQRPKLLFFEPQTCEILNLSQSEVESCRAVRF